jgi:hypothetical protein
MKKQVFLLLCIMTFTFVKAQVNLRSGAAEFSLPIFSFSNQNKLTTNISLNYFNGNGLLVSEVASCVGTGWNLSYGGVITREQRGLPDDQCRDLILQNPLPVNLSMTHDEYLNSYYPNGYLFSSYSPSDVISNEGTYIKELPGQVTWTGMAPEKESISADREQDVFHLIFGNTNLEFVIGKNMQVKCLNDSRIRIEAYPENMLSQNIKTRISKFIVTDVDGIQYTFSDKELSKLFTYDIHKTPNNQQYITETETPDPFMWPDPNNPNSMANIQVNIGKQTSNWIVTKWYLSEIKNPLTSNKILFTYENFDKDIRTTRQINSVVDESGHGQVSVVINREFLKALRIKNINCDNDKNIDFVYEEGPRIDVPGDKPLKQVQIKQGNEVMMKYAFEYGYFFTSAIKPYSYTFNSDEKMFTRLCLKTIQKIGKRRCN